jgi:hypothetical protein
MRKLIVGALVSLDGVQEAPRSWAAHYFDDVAAMLMGRKTYECRALRLAGTEQRPTGVVSLVYGR